ncbi:gustatory receptor for sugar taste 64a [Asbolus verrucosus]|uniref:Gustatory receptor n=1 Tax=Asbolus verrucosus TaxID=1661398 RepID=A0A482W4Y3_ASBVE|nr:gustatory receptor for sugar taste 64a [Asbolus verrucosus]
MSVNIRKKVAMSGSKPTTRPPTTHNCLRIVLITAQAMGNFAIDNLRAEEPGKLKFKFKSWKVLHTALFSFAYLFCASFSLYKSLTVGILLNQLISPLFYFHSFITSLLFLQLAYRWPHFMAQWSKIEIHLLKNYKATTDLSKKINYSAVTMILVALLEHTLAVCNFVYSSNCQNSSTGAEHLFKKEFHFIFNYMPYHFIFGLLLTFISWTATFLWNFADVFIVLISMIMTERFRQINQKIKINVEEVNSSSNDSSASFIKVYNTDFPKAEYKLWRQIREDYNNLNNIMSHLDQILSNLVLLSYSFNLTFILVQLFNSLRQMDSVIEGIYFFYSFGFVIARIVTVSIFGALINEESQAAMPYLTSLPTEFYNEEIQRLITQIHVDSAALTGHNFFRITKGLVLSVAAAIITYELVLIQFNQATLNKYMTANETICF